MKKFKALLSVADKTDIVNLAKFLIANDFEILSTGGTFNILLQNNIKVTQVSDYTQFPEIMDGRVKTLHPKIHAGILHRPKIDEKVLHEQNIDPIHLVVVNLYPFAKTIANPDCSFENAIENIDIGGPAMLRAAAKNHQNVLVITDPADYIKLQNNFNKIDENFRLYLAAKTFAHTAEYDARIAKYLNNEEFPENYITKYSKKFNLRYGENPHQKAAFYQEESLNKTGIAYADKLQGKALSFNNIADADAALNCISEFNNPACVIVKHANPCAVAISENITNAYWQAFNTDPNSSFGGIIAFNRILDSTTTKNIINNQFVELIIAPEITNDSLELLSKKPNIRLLIAKNNISDNNLTYKKVSGGLLIQQSNNKTIEKLEIVTKIKPSEDQINDLKFAWMVTKHVKSNAIVYAKNSRTLGIGAGQMSRIYSAKIAAIKAKDYNLDLNNAVMASDAFFPFADSIEEAHKNGIISIIQPGGSIRDQEVIDKANQLGISMVFTGIRHFLH